VRFHDLRHTFGTRCAAAGVPLRTLQAWMGHADIKTTMSTRTMPPARTRRSSSTGSSSRTPGHRRRLLRVQRAEQALPASTQLSAPRSDRDPYAHVPVEDCL
jgi:hypothetical protein